jgi:hypothetical protein
MCMKMCATHLPLKRAPKLKMCATHLPLKRVPKRHPARSQQGLPQGYMQISARCAESS